MGDEFISVAIVAQIFIFHAFFSGNFSVMAEILVAKNLVNKIIKYTIAMALLNLILSLLLVREFGLEGVVLGTKIPYILISIPYTRVMLVELNINWKDYLRNVVLKTYPIGAFVAILLYSITTIHYPLNLFEVAFFGILGFVAYMIPFYMFSLNGSERTLVRSLLHLKIDSHS